MGPVAFIVIGLSVFGIVSYIVLMFFYPEWVGITGTSAKKINESHIEGTQSDDVNFVNPEAPKKS